jgi:predicted lipid-binding transport protein (Tim44 family)
MNKNNQDLGICPRCKTENEFDTVVCWQCEIELNRQLQQQQAGQTSRSVGAKVASGVGMGIAGVLAGAMGGIMIGFMIVIVAVLAILNAISEFFESCAGMLMFLSLAFGTAVYSIFGWLF